MRERAVPMVCEHQHEHASQWAAIGSMAAKFGCTAETLRSGVRQAERDRGFRAGATSAERDRIKASEREVSELRQANEILRKASAFLPRRSSTAASSHEGVHRRAPCRLRGGADLPVLPIAPSTYCAHAARYVDPEKAFCAGKSRCSSAPGDPARLK